MLSNGANPDNLDEETFRQVCVMYADGHIGNRAIVKTLGKLTGAVYNYMRESNKPPYQLQDILEKGFYDYLYPPQDNTKAVNNSLLAYMTQAKGFRQDRFKGA